MPLVKNNDELLRRCSSILAAARPPEGAAGSAPRHRCKAAATARKPCMAAGQEGMDHACMARWRGAKVRQGMH